MTAYYDTLDTAMGPFSIAVDANGAVVATAFGGADELMQMRGVDALEPDTERPRAAMQQVREYFDGKRSEFDLPLSPDGTAFQLRVWQALRTVPYGETRSYAWLAAQVGSAPRAVGGANGSNPISLIVPCHRIIGADGSLTGFGWGVEIKQALLEHEHAPVTAGLAAASAPARP